MPLSMSQISYLILSFWLCYCRLPFLANHNMPRFAFTLHHARWMILLHLVKAVLTNQKLHRLIKREKKGGRPTTLSPP
jgi:hypothetical protein